ncbi:MAG: dTDP-4-dehydrorhamnose 3,5-epimerase [Oscillospiraceae bacterium]|nr:dTDP-4-dehydrorhamnose 3,5-epimerase [Oscillospiraceae bacterium]
MEIVNTLFDKALILRQRINNDVRGSMNSLYNEKELSELLDGFIIRNLRSYSMPKAGTFFGIHYQDGNAPMNKLITVICGQGKDYIIDLRRSSPTYLEWEQTELSAENGYSVYVPHGFGHAFISTADDTIQIFAADAYGGAGVSKQLNYREPAIGLVLPIPVTHISD